jgi:FlaA1/EpsC-like NDP-sugar epimerase
MPETPVLLLGLVAVMSTITSRPCMFADLTRANHVLLLSQISGVTATVFGANGFIGSYVVNELAKRGAQVIVPFRCTENGVQHLKQMGDLGQVRG